MIQQVHQGGADNIDENSERHHLGAHGRWWYSGYGCAKFNRDVHQTDWCQLRVVKNGSLDRDQRRGNERQGFSGTQKVRQRRSKSKERQKGQTKGLQQGPVL